MQDMLDSFADTLTMTHRWFDVQDTLLIEGICLFVCLAQMTPLICMYVVGVKEGYAGVILLCEQVSAWASDTTRKVESTNL